MIFNGIEKEYLKVLRGRDRPAWAPVDRTIVTTLGVPGGYLTDSRTAVRKIDVPIFIIDKSFSDLQKMKEDMAEWLIHKEPKELIFKDEMDRSYFAVVDGGIDLDELMRWGLGTISFICPDPYKYGQEKPLTFPASGILTLDNEGTAETEPVFELTAKDKATFAMVANSEGEYNLIGKPADVEEVIVDEKTSKVDERGDTLSNWDTAGTKVDGEVTGTLSTDGTGIVANTFGTGNLWHGPALLKEISPIDDFEVEMRVEVNQTNANQTFRIEFYLFDENMNEIGKMAVVNRHNTRIEYSAEGRVGEYEGTYVNYPINARNYTKNLPKFHGILRMKRIRNRFEFYVARIGVRGITFQHFDTLTQYYNDVDKEYGGKLKYVEIHIGKYGNTNAPPAPNMPKIHSFQVFERNRLTDDQTPYIIDIGDVVTFDHKNKDILLNGESRKDLKNFGGSFFDINKGVNTITISPEGVFDAEVTYRDKYL